ELDVIRSSTLSALIERNTSITGLPANVFTQGTAVAAPAPGGSPGSSAESRTFNGTGNNPGDPKLGTTGSHLLRNFTSAYADGISEPSGTDRPNARAISNAVASQSSSIPNPDGLTMAFVIWGQLIDHDLGLTPAGTTNTIKFHGEMLTGGTPHPFVAEKL